MALAPVSAAAPSTSSTSAFGLDFQSLLRIILTQLTYQDPLKPMDNFQFVSQLAQFSQLQQGQSLNDQIASLIASQAATQATSLLGRTVDFATATGSTALQTGVIKSVSFARGQPEVTVETAAGEIIANISIANISQVR
jgi:flagellar basal-body rod modification protein FlgD